MSALFQIYDYEDGQLAVKTPYNKQYIAEIKAQDGWWNSLEKAWIVDRDKKEIVKKIIKNIYEVDMDSFDPEEEVKIKYRAYDFYKWSRIKVGGVTMAARYERDDPVRLYFDTYVVEGGFPESGGNSRTPDVDADSGTILVSTIPLGLYNALTKEEKEKIIEVEEVDNTPKTVREYRSYLDDKIERMEKEIKILKYKRKGIREAVKNEEIDWKDPMPKDLM